MKKIVLIACVSKKGNEKAAARDLYKSQLFKNSLAYARSLNPDEIFILSALHHLLHLDKEIEPYNVTLSKVPKHRVKPGLKILDAAEKEAWGEKVIEQLSKQADLKNDHFVLLAGQEYIKPLANKLARCEEPLKGLGLFSRVKFLKSKLRPV